MRPPSESCPPLAATAALLVPRCLRGCVCCPGVHRCSEDPTPPVTLGDSYSAGNGAGAYVEKTCWRSPTWPAGGDAAGCRAHDGRVQRRRHRRHPLRVSSGPRRCGPGPTASRWVRSTHAPSGCARPRRTSCAAHEPARLLLHLLDPLERLGGLLFTATVRCQLVAPADRLRDDLDRCGLR